MGVNQGILAVEWRPSSIKPHCISPPSQVPGELFFHFQSLLSGHLLLIEVVVKARPQVCSIFVHNRRRNVMPLLTQIPRFMLPKPLRGLLTRHTYIKTLQHAVKLRIGGSKPAVFGIYFFQQLNDINLVSRSSHM